MKRSPARWPIDFHVDVNAYLIREGAKGTPDGGLLTNAELDFLLLMYNRGATPERTGQEILEQRAAFKDAVGVDRSREICVRFQGDIQRPRFQDEGAARAFLAGLQSGYRTPEPEVV